MPEPARIGLDNPAFFGRLRQPAIRRPATDTIRLRTRPATRHTDAQIVEPAAAGGLTGTAEAPQPVWMHPLSRQDPNVPVVTPGESSLTTFEPITLVKPQPFVAPGRPKQQRSNVLKRQFVRRPAGGRARRLSLSRYSKPQLTLIAMACLVFLFGLAASLQTILTNHNAAAQVAVLSKKVDKQAGNQNSALPSTTKPSGSALSSYAVAPDLPRYIRIPKLGVYARVLQVGVTTGGALGTPPDVYDTAWYTGSAKPGQPGAMLIDGHVSSWTAHGVFYSLKNLKPGDQIQIQRGDGALFNYQVVRSQVYPDGNVDMQSAITPVTAGKSGLNLITCTGQVKPGTSEFNERVIVYTQQV